MSVLAMNVPHPDDPDIMLEYELPESAASPNKYAAMLAKRRRVLLEPDVAEAFPTAEAVNEALRRLIKSSSH